MASSSKTCIVIPCYNEAERLDVGAFHDHVQQHPDHHFVMVNDGSKDETLALLQRMVGQDSEHFSVVDQQPNQGKAEAVRSGVLAAFEHSPRHVGYWDADLATPLDEIPRFVDVLEEHDNVLVVFGARAQLLGRTIARSPTRHYLGRVFATAASQMLQLAIYDTQCGAKLFRATQETRALFAEPFLVNWTFDVEIIARLIQATRDSNGPPVHSRIYELPLRRWCDVAGSKVKPGDFAKALGEMWRIRRRYLAD